MASPQQGPFRRLYATGTGADICTIITKVGSDDMALGADWTPAAGDVQISKDGAAFANIGTLPVVVASSHGSVWKFVFTNGELTAKTITIALADAAAKVVQDMVLTIETYGNASAMHPGEYVALDGIEADSISTAAYVALEATAGSNLLDAFTADHDTATTVGKAILDSSTAGASNGTALSSLATAVDSLPQLAEMLTAFGDLVGTSPGGGTSGELTLDATASNSDNTYNGWIAVLIAGTGAVAAQVVQDFVGATRTCVMTDIWPTTPDASTQYVLLRAGS